MQSGLTVVFTLVISRHSTCDTTLRVLTVTAKAKVCILEMFQQKHKQFRSEYKFNTQMAVCDRFKVRSTGVYLQK